MKDQKKIKRALCLLAVIVILPVLILLLQVLRERRAEKELLRDFAVQIMDHAEVYVPNERAAHGILKAQGQLLRSSCDQNGVRKIEGYLEKTYGMEAVNLRDMDEEAAGYLRDACDYMYRTYPILNGYLTNITVQDEVSDSVAAIALFETDTYIINPSPDRLYPMVIKKQVLLRAKDWENTRRLNNSVRINVRDGFWTEGTDVTAVLVHELGHALVSCILSHKCGLDNAIFVDEKNGDAYSAYNMQQLAGHQEFVKSLCDNAYERYKDETGESIPFEDFCGQISGYAKGIQDDGGISYEETVAEAVSNVYVHGDECARPAGLIMEEIDRSIEELNEQKR
ncbi:MAG: hypothetical protein K6A71_06880 [Lachnospiraceae bacterium]|nr:hypothetical protein [Lachnospiraceae bacterium]